MLNRSRFLGLEWNQRGRLLQWGPGLMAGCLRSPAFIALMLIFCVDLGLRCVPLEFLLPTQVGSAAEYRAILADIQTRENCDICFVGDSRMSEAIRLPRLRRELEGSSLAADQISNYGVSLATVSMIRAVSERVLKRGSVRVMVIGVTAETFLAKPNPSLPYGLFIEPELRYFYEKRGTDQGWKQEHRSETLRWLRSSSQMSLAWQAQLGSYWWTFRFRDRPKQWFEDLWRPRNSTNRTVIGKEVERKTEVISPLLGGNPIRQSEEPQRNLVNTPVRQIDVKRHIENKIGMNHRWIRPDSLQEISVLLAECRRRGVLPILLEIPLPNVLLKHYPVRTQRDFVEAMRKFERQFAAVFLEWNDEEEELNGKDFLDFSHLNRQGATKFTQIFARRLKSVVSPDDLTKQRP